MPYGIVDKPRGLGSLREFVEDQNIRDAGPGIGTVEISLLAAGIERSFFGHYPVNFSIHVNAIKKDELRVCSFGCLNGVPHDSRPEFPPHFEVVLQAYKQVYDGRIRNCINRLVKIVAPLTSLGLRLTNRTRSPLLPSSFTSSFPIAPPAPRIVCIKAPFTSLFRIHHLVQTYAMQPRASASRISCVSQRIG
jgi:hypothetical protein